MMAGNHMMIENEGISPLIKITQLVGCIEIEIKKITDPPVVVAAVVGVDHLMLQEQDSQTKS